MKIGKNLTHCWKNFQGKMNYSTIITATKITKGKESQENLLPPNVGSIINHLQ